MAHRMMRVATGTAEDAAMVSHDVRARRGRGTRAGRARSGVIDRPEALEPRNLVSALLDPLIGSVVAPPAEVRVVSEAMGSDRAEGHLPYVIAPLPRHQGFELADERERPADGAARDRGPAPEILVDRLDRPERTSLIVLPGRLDAAGPEDDWLTLIPSGHHLGGPPLAQPDPARGIDETPGAVPDATPEAGAAPIVPVRQLFASGVGAGSLLAASARFDGVALAGGAFARFGDAVATTTSCGCPETNSGGVDIIVYEYDGVTPYSAQKEDEVGGIVVKRADDNAAPRQGIAITGETSPFSEGCHATLTWEGGIRIYTAAEGGQQIQSGVRYTIAEIALPRKALWVEGVTESDEMRDVTITLTHEDGTVSVPSDTVKFTVAWAEMPTIKAGFNDQVSDDNDKKDDWAAITASGEPDLGPATKLTGPGNPAIGVAYETKAIVHPSSLDHPDVGSYISRYLQSRYYYEDDNDGSTLHPLFGEKLNSYDTSLPGYRDDTPANLDPPVGAGSIYDIDNPRLIYPNSPPPLGRTARYRANFTTYVTFWLATYTGGYNDRPHHGVTATRGVRGSLERNFYVNYSYRQMDAPDGFNFQEINDATGDNRLGYGSTSTSWNLQ